MAQIYLVRDGTASDYRTNHRGHVVPNSVAAEKLSKFEKKYFSNPPSINPERGPASAWDEFGHVVVKIDEAEADTHFPKAGYYYVVGLSPKECQSIFGMSDQ